MAKSQQEDAEQQLQYERILSKRAADSEAALAAIRSRSAASSAHLGAWVRFHMAGSGIELYQRCCKSANTVRLAE